MFRADTCPWWQWDQLLSKFDKKVKCGLTIVWLSWCKNWVRCRQCPRSLPSICENREGTRYWPYICKEDTRTVSAPAPPYRRPWPIFWFRMRTIFIVVNYTIDHQLFKNRTRNNKSQIGSCPSAPCGRPRTLNYPQLILFISCFIALKLPYFLQHPS